MVDYGRLGGAGLFWDQLGRLVGWREKGRTEQGRVRLRRLKKRNTVGDLKMCVDSFPTIFNTKKRAYFGWGEKWGVKETFRKRKTFSSFCKPSDSVPCGRLRDVPWCKFFHGVNWCVAYEEGEEEGCRMEVG